jgi:diacylglycerol kinase
MKTFISGLFHAIEGILYSWNIGRNFRIQVWCGVVSLVLCVLLNVQGWEWIVVLILTGGVLSLETLNSSIEKLCDLISVDRDPKIKTIKDLSAGAVLIFSVIAMVIGCLIFIPKIILVFS